MQTFQTKQDVDNFLREQDATQSLPKICAPIPKIVAKENPELFDKICEMIENAKTTCARYGSRFVTTMYGDGFQLSYDASRVPRAYAFVCLLKQQLPE